MDNGDNEVDTELNDIDFLRDLAERLMNVPGTYGTDQYHCDRLYWLADKLEASEKIESLDKNSPGWRDLKHSNGAPVYSETGMLLDKNGERSIFDDVDE